MVSTAGGTRVDTIDPISTPEAEQLCLELIESMATLLRGLTDEEWLAPTDCELWTVRDIIGHICGWCEALLSPRALSAQFAGAIKRRGEFGNVIDAQNQVQVDLQRTLTTDELLAKFEKVAPAAAKFRRRAGRAIGWTPLYIPYMGGWIRLKYLTNAIFPRDLLVHRIDISRATNKAFGARSSDRRVVQDIARDWFSRSNAMARLDLTGEVSDSIVPPGTPQAQMTVDGLEFVRLLFGRADRSVVAVEGDEAAAARWLDTFFPL